MADDDAEVCPLCMEPMEADDLAFYPCDCRYQVCRFCWAKILNEENGLCPACRKEYNSEKPALYKPVTESDDPKLRNRKRKEHTKKAKLSSEMLKILPELRVVQPNLIFVVGLPSWVCKDKEVLKGPEYFGRYGKVFKVEINQNQTFGGPQGQPCFSAYITFCRSEDAMRSIRELDQSMLHGRSLRVSLGTTKYCSQFLRGTKCSKHECMYLHELGDPAASFTKEEMQAGKHTEYMNKLLSEYIAASPVSAHNCVDLTGTDCSPALSSSCEVDTGSAPIKDVSNSVSVSCSRSRIDTDYRVSYVSSPFKPNGPARPHSRRTANIESSVIHPSGEDRRTRQYRRDPALADYGPSSSNEHSLLPTIKDNIWNRHLENSNYCTNDVKRSSNQSGTRSLTQSYLNGLDNLDHGRSHRRPHHLRTEQGRGSRRPSSGNYYSSSPHAGPHCSATTQLTSSWQSHNPQSTDFPEGSQFGDEPVDIDFDPFRESQQGLAELLAAEVNKLNVSENIPLRGTYNSCSQFSRTCDPNDIPRHGILGPQCTSEDTSDFHAEGMVRVNCPWRYNFSHDDQNNRTQCTTGESHSADPFTSQIHPPPGFEEGAPISSVYSGANPNSSEFTLSSSPYYGTSSAVDYSSSGVPHVNEPLLHNHPGYSVPFDLDGSSQQSKNPDSPLHCGSGTVCRGGHGGSSAGSQPFRSDPSRPESQQAIADFFAAAFNAASAMLNSRASLSTDSKNSSAPKSTGFDLGAFFSQLCRQSPFLNSLNPSSGEWVSVNGNGRHSADLQEAPLDSSSVSSNTSVIFPSIPFPSISTGTPPPPDCRRDGNVPFTTLNPGLQKQGSLSTSIPSATHPDIPSENSFFGVSPTGGFQLSPDLQSSGPLNWHLGDPAVVSTGYVQQPGDTWKSSSNSCSPMNVLQQLWRTGTGIQPLFEAHLSGLSSQLSPVDNSANSIVSNGTSRTSFRDPSVHSVSHVRSAD